MATPSFRNEPAPAHPLVPGARGGVRRGGRVRSAGRALLGSAPLVLALLATGAGTGCETPEQRYQVLTLFFDGVPPPGSPALPSPAQTPPPTPELDSPASALRPPSPARWQPPSAHTAFARNKCKDCHVGFSSELVLEGEELCWSCHEREKFPGSVQHGPMAAGECVACHSPHESANPALLRERVPELCHECHDRSTFAEDARHRAAERDDCTRCHDPHATDRDFMLELDPGEM